MNSEETKTTVVSLPENIPEINENSIPKGYETVSGPSSLVSEQRHNPLSSEVQQPLTSSVIQPTTTEHTTVETKTADVQIQNVPSPSTTATMTQVQQLQAMQSAVPLTGIQGLTGLQGLQAQQLAAQGLFVNPAMAAQMANVNSNPLMTAQMIQAHQLQKQINKYPSWPPPEQQQYQTFHPMGWPLDPEFPYQLSNYLTPNPAMNANAMGIGSAAQQLSMASLTNPMLNQLNPFTNAVSNPLAMGINPMLAQAAAAAAMAGNPTGKQYSLFVFHLPEDIDDHGLLQLFAAYGAMRSNVMRHETGRSRGFGFVHFNNRNEAQIAIDMMNGHQIGRKRLRVSFKREEPDENIKRQQLFLQQQMLQQQHMLQGMVPQMNNLQNTQAIAAKIAAAAGNTMNHNAVGNQAQGAKVPGITKTD